MYIGSPFYLGSLTLLIGILWLLWIILRRCRVKNQHRVVLALMAANLIQHLLKPLIYPQYFGMGFNSLSSAYNVCACLIFISPVVYLRGNKMLRNFTYFGGAFAGLTAVAVPVWYLGMDVSCLGWDYARFYICHGLLFVSSALPLMLGHHKLSWQDFWQVGVVFFGVLVTILLNDVIFISAGLFPGTDPGNLYESLVHLNPFSIMGPPEGYAWLGDVAAVFTPDFFLGANPAGCYVPILWYAIPLYLLMSGVSFCFFAVMDRKRFLADLRKIKEGVGHAGSE